MGDQQDAPAKGETMFCTLFKLFAFIKNRKKRFGKL